MRVLVAGDFYPNNRAIPLIKGHNPSFIDPDISRLVKSCDFSIVNFECPIVEDSDCYPILKSGPNLKTGSYAASFIKDLGFKMATLANNHTLDYGGKALLYTKKCLENEGILTIGAGENLNEASKTSFVNVNGQLLAIINCCEHESSIAKADSPGANPLSLIKQFNCIREAKEIADFILIIVHGGNENYQLPSPRMQETYRFFIEQGADAVINHHQHCPCGYEVWKGKPIFYGIGNFCFDSHSPASRNDSLWNYGYMVDIIFSGEVSFFVHPFKQFSNNAGIELLRDEERVGFMRGLEALNDIVINPEEVKRCYEEAMKKMSKGLKFLFTPWQGRFFTKLFSRGLLPPFMSKNKTIIYHNCFQCESQIDKIQILLNSIYESYG